MTRTGYTPAMLRRHAIVALQSLAFAIVVWGGIFFVFVVL